LISERNAYEPAPKSFGAVRRGSQQAERQQWEQHQQAELQRQQQQLDAQYQQGMQAWRQAYGACMTAKDYQVQ
jgi:Sec-independent protein translocase protein TatA